jgi:hypothetical protein
MMLSHDMDNTGYVTSAALDTAGDGLAGRVTSERFAATGSAESRISRRRNKK